jgi:hypothetical protein
MAAVSISTVPRDVAELQKLKRSQLIRLAIQLHLLDDDKMDQAFKSMNPDQQAVEVCNALIAYDQGGGAQAPQAQPQMQVTAPQQQPPMQQQPVQPPPQQMAPPPQFQAPVPPGAQVQPPMTPQPPPQQQPPQQYQAPQAPQPPPQQQQYQAPPQYQMPQQPQFQAPVPPQPPAVSMPQQQQQQQYQAPQAPMVPSPPPQQPPQPERQPLTASDPGNAGAGQAAPMGQLVTILGQLVEMSKAIGKGVDTIGRGLNGGVQLQRVQLQVLLVLCEQQGIDADDLAKLVSYQDADAVEKFISKLGGAGKS